ncbi:MAG: chorismate mutase [Proteobacteria bacterium]|nr:chorismate mutase [Pseudomonadota bacterium]
MTEKQDQRIANIRNAIDAVDRRIIALLQERATLASEIGRVKKDLGLPILDPAREGRIRDKLAHGPRGPMDTEQLVRIYEMIMAESRRLQEED